MYSGFNSNQEPNVVYEALSSEMTALGLMSGTSRDGIDAAIVRTDGISIIERGPSARALYSEDFRARLSGLIAGVGDTSEVESELTAQHAALIYKLLEKNNLTNSEIDIIGFHGHTILHAPDEHRTHQIGDGALLSKLTGILVVNDLRSADVMAGGQGAPLAPAYHWALARNLPKPVAILNLGGVANVTWIGESRSNSEMNVIGGNLIPQLWAFDTGPGNALLDDWAAKHIGARFDRDGELASAGCVNSSVLKQLLQHPYFSLTPPKSLDRDAFSLEPLQELSPQDGAATLVAFTAQAVCEAAHLLPSEPLRWFVTGGGRHNKVLMGELAARLGRTVEPVEVAGWDGNVLEAEAFAFLAVRAIKQWPLSWPTTTGVARPCVGGVIHRPSGC